MPDLSEVVVRYPACTLRLGGGGSIIAWREQLHDLGEVQCEGVEGVLLLSGVQGALSVARGVALGRALVCRAVV